jgi:hypothetical protein
MNELMRGEQRGRKERNKGSRDEEKKEENITGS